MIKETIRKQKPYLWIYLVGIAALIIAGLIGRATAPGDKSTVVYNGMIKTLVELQNQNAQLQSANYQLQTHLSILQATPNSTAGTDLAGVINAYELRVTALKAETETAKDELQSEKSNTATLLTQAANAQSALINSQNREAETIDLYDTYRIKLDNLWEFLKSVKARDNETATSNLTESKRKGFFEMFDLLYPEMEETQVIEK